MAQHVDLARTDDPLRHLVSPSHREGALKCASILSAFPQISVHRIQKPSDRKYTGWYLYGLDHRPPTILYFTILPNGTVNVEFKYSAHVPPDIFERLTWQNATWKYAKISPRHFDVDEVKKMLMPYLGSLAGPLAEGKVREGGKSTVEEMVSRIIAVAAPGEKQERNMRRDWIIGEKGKPLELDIYLPGQSVAFEIQGPHHREDHFGKPEQLSLRRRNDVLKVKACLGRGISVVWMRDTAVMKDLMRRPEPERPKELRAILDKCRAHRPAWIIWDGVGTSEIMDQPR